MGVLLSAFLMSYAFSQLPAGVLVDRVGRRILLGVGLVIWSVAQGAAGFVTSYAQFFASIGRTGVFVAVPSVFGIVGSLCSATAVRSRSSAACWEPRR
jgi:sugar phosphate permease